MSKASVFRLVIAIALTFSANAYANQNTGKIKITFLENWVAGEGVYLKTDQSSLTNPAGCPTTASYHMSTNASDIARSMLISAYIAGKPVKLTIYDGGCSSNRPQIVSVAFED